MIQNFGYHTHTYFSDGANSVEEMVEQACRLGFQKIGISDHLIVHKNIKQSPSYQETTKTSHSSFEEMLDVCNRHAEEIRKAGRKFNIKTLVGYEVDYITYSGWEEEFREYTKKIDHDYFINGNHFLMSDNGENVFDIWRIEKYPDVAPESFETYIKRHFETMQAAVCSKLFVFLAHLDYIQKISTYRQENYQKEIDAVVNALKDTKTGCEISTKGIRKFGHFYPSESILKSLILKNIPLVISDDAHSTLELGSYFEDAEKSLEKLNCTNRLSF